MFAKVPMNSLLWLLVAVSLVSADDWSWSKSKAEEGGEEPIKSTGSVTKIEEESAAQKVTREGAGRSYHEQVQSVHWIPQVVLPLESNSQVDLETIRQHLQEEGIGEEERQARFLGISDKLCKIGIKGMCSQPDGYPVAIPSHYGHPVNTYTQYGPPEKNYEVIESKPKIKPITKFFNDLVKPFKKNKNKKIPSTYLPPPVPIQSYQPQSTYAKPEQPPIVAPYPPTSFYKPQPQVYKPPKKIGYQPPTDYGVPQKPFVKATPIYSAPKPIHNPVPPKPHYDLVPEHAIPSHSYKEVQSSYFGPKPSDIITRPEHKHVLKTHVIHPSPTANVQHIHTHTHIYEGNQAPVHHISGQYPRESDGVYQESSQVITSANQDSVFVSDNNFADNSFGEKKFGDKTFISSQSVPVNQGSNFDNFVPNVFESSQDKRHVQQQANNNVFSQVQPKETPFDSQLSGNVYRRNPYVADCQCVPSQFCSPDHLVARSNPGDFSHLLDARNKPTDILSNATAEAEEEQSIDEAEEDYEVAFDLYDEVEDGEVPATEHPDEEQVPVTEAVPDETEVKPAKEDNKTEIRRKRSAEKTKKKEVKEEIKEKPALDLGLEGRQLTGYTPGPSGCGHNYVCCKRPVYVKPKPKPLCGRGNPSIHGRVSTIEYESGQSDFGEYPWQAAILRNEGQDSMFVCGATLIDELHLITAAHCVKDKNLQDLKIRLGEWDVNRDTEFYKHVELPVAGVIVHPEFYSGNLYNDIAVIKMAAYADIQSSPHISPICLPDPKSDFTNHRCMVTGWGKNAFGDQGKFQHILKELELPVVDRRECQSSLQTTRLGKDYKLHHGFICAGGEKGRDACKGDGGGPLVCATPDRTYHLAGIVSWGIGCGHAGIPGVYVNVPHFVPWIRSIVRA